MKKILIPVDFSECSLRAVQYAIDLASNTNTELHFVHLVEMDYSFTGGSALGAQFAIEREEDKPSGQIKEVFEKANDLMVDLLSEHKGLNHQTCILHGDLIGEVMTYIDEHSVDLVVMGSHGQRGLNKMLIGSNAQKMIRYSKVPVIIVKDSYQTGEFKNIVYTSDFKNEGMNESLEYVKSISEFYKSNLHLLYINTPNRFEDSDVVDERIRHIQTKYEIPKSTYSTFNSSWIEEGIIKYADRSNTDLLVINTHGFKGIKKLFHHSIAESVVNNCDVPVMIINKD